MSRVWEFVRQEKLIIGAAVLGIAAVYESSFMLGSLAAFLLMAWALE